ncbi:MAG: hypothetical protein ACRD36_09270, partial [Candidatus Acidiferrum sp.]
QWEGHSVDALIDESTRIGTIVGTIAYMSPEQARGEVDKLDARTDVFGLGAILCAILAGVPPNRGRDAAAVVRRLAAGDLGDTFDLLQNAPSPTLVNRLARRCLAPVASDRPAHAGEVAAGLHSITKFLETAVRKNEVETATAKAEEYSRRTRRRSKAFGLITAAAVLITTATIALSALVNANREVAAQDAVRRQVEIRRIQSREMYPLVLEALGKDVRAGMFARGWDATGRGASMDRVRRILVDVNPEEQAQGHLCLAAAAGAIPEDSLVASNWRVAAERYSPKGGRNGEALLACAAITWQFPVPLRHAVLTQARDKLRIARNDGELPDKTQKRVKEALAAVEKVLGNTTP